MKKLIFLFTFFISSLFCYSQQNGFIIAENYFRNGEYEKAIQLYKELHNKSPYNTTYLKRLISCYQETNQFLVAESLLLKKLKKYPKQTYTYVMLGYNFERKQEINKADEQYKNALESVKNNSGYGGIIANLFKNYNKLDYALKAYNGIMDNNPKANYGFQLAQIYGEKGDFEKMFDSYVNLVDRNEKYLNNIKRYASKYINDDSENENNTLLRKSILKKSISKPKNVWNDLLAWLFIKQKQYQKALIQHKALLARDADNLSGIKNLGKIAFENKDYETAKECFDIVIEKTNYPTDKFRAVYMNLQVDIVTKQPNIEEKFQQIFTKFGSNRNTLFIQLAYADFLTFTKNNPEKGIKVLEKAMSFTNSKFTKASVKLKLGEILVFTRNFNKALIYFSQVQTQFKNHFLAQEARFKVAQASYFKNDFKWAKAQLKILKGSATQLIANDAAELFLTISDNQSKDSISTGLKEYAKADLLAYQNKNKEAIGLLSEIITTYKSQPIEDEALYKQAQLFVKQEAYANAIDNFTKILQLDPEGILVDNSLYELGELYNKKLNNPEKASEYYQKIIFDHASSIYLVDARKKYRKLRGDNI
ncbi:MULTISPECIES: tetratricopeptide repeat protein [Tenacibaculum]|uniref:tetratricopeptide repeat protein n=1 Tax=Tenacibaculum TaxID=104267 RepID=UPI00089CB7FF|nr:MULTISPECIES: tetratricopeptide repeat protein [unclassified Tenacibaculum]RBW59364.1 tetratricopeptide repeat protein [Tenacibaculum sp. E3R01]SEE04434.1 pentatricopeptide repeat domain-containing protein (PPR motif) [Tenacibaculum sp. MAR_2010_89]